MADTMSDSARITALEADLASYKGDVDTFFLLFCGAIVFLMQAGFATLSAGSIRQKNVKNILLKNLLDACMGALTFYFIGFGIAYDGRGVSKDANGFIGLGGDTFTLAGLGNANDVEGDPHGNAWIGFFFQFAFAAAAATIVSGAVAERCQLIAYLIYTMFITGIIYPVVVHWVWDSNGFLSAFNDGNTHKFLMTGCIDFAGSGVVHMTGGFAAMIGAKILGPRLNRFEEPSLFEGHSTPLVIIGTFLLWFGWYGFNPGSALVIQGYGRDVGRAAVTTTLSAAAGGVTGLFIKKKMPAKLGGTGVWDIAHTCNSLLGGLVGITAGCSTVVARDAIFIGVIAAFFYHAASCLMRKLKIDDPLDAFAVHGSCGLWGVWAVGLFCHPDYSYVPNPGSEAYAKDGFDYGIFYGGRGELFGTQIVTTLIEISWVVTTSGILFFLLKVAGIFRVSADEETLGMDVSKHGGTAYPHEGVKS